MRLTRNIILTLLIIVLCSAMAFASDDSPSPEQAPLVVDWRSLDLQTSAGAVRAVEKTVTDVYNLLDDIFYGDSPYAMGILAQIADMLDFEAGNTTYTIADLQGMTWSLANSINNQLSSTNSILGNIYNNIGTTNAKLEYVFSAIEDTINIKWYASGFNYVGSSLGFDNNYLSSNTPSYDLKIIYHTVTDTAPCLLRFLLPIQGVNDNFQYSTLKLNQVALYRSGALQYFSPNFDYFFEPTTSGTYLYLFDFDTLNNYDVYFQITSSQRFAYFTSLSQFSNCVEIPFDTMDYQVIKTAFYQAKAANNQSDLTKAAQDLANYFVSPAKQAAEQSSNEVIQETLDDFTGSGTGAAKKADSKAMKDVSGSIQSGLNSGGSVSGATGVFNSGSDFWGWFTQQNSNYINNPYPAPVVSPTRGAGDEIVDFLTPNSNELQDLLRQGGDQR